MELCNLYFNCCWHIWCIFKIIFQSVFTYKVIVSIVFSLHFFTYKVDCRCVIVLSLLNEICSLVIVIGISLKFQVLTVILQFYTKVSTLQIISNTFSGFYF